MPTLASILICTRNRADALAETLSAMGNLHIPQNMTAELIVVNNASTDHTADVLQRTTLPNIPIQSVTELKPGLSNARNRALAAAKGDIFLFTDDDVRPPADWIAHLTAPILSGQAEAVVGGVHLAPSLRRSWMNAGILSLLADTTHLHEAVEPSLVGANMVFARSVLEKVPQFDPELGAGASGFSEETLFSWQLREAGCRLKMVLHPPVIHYPDSTRFNRANFLQTARKLGTSRSYLLHHWMHTDIEGIERKMLGAWYRLIRWRLRHPGATHRKEGIQFREIQLLQYLSELQAFVRERERPRHYEKHGLVRIR